jgi:hypothetical protein
MGRERERVIIFLIIAPVASSVLACRLFTIEKPQSAEDRLMDILHRR